MSSIMKELKSEISRLAKKVVVKELAPIRQVNASQRGLIANLRRQVTELQKQVGLVRKAVPNSARVPESAIPAAELKGRFWISGKGIRTLRKRLGLTQIELAKLANVSGQTVVNWEATKGKINLRSKSTAGRLMEIRRLTKKTAAIRLGKKLKRVRRARKEPSKSVVGVAEAAPKS